jgi:hypothetical protein
VLIFSEKEIGSIVLISLDVCPLQEKKIKAVITKKTERNFIIGWF